MRHVVIHRPHIQLCFQWNMGAERLLWPFFFFPHFTTESLYLYNYGPFFLVLAIRETLWGRGCVVLNTLCHKDCSFIGIYATELLHIWSLSCISFLFYFQVKLSGSVCQRTSLTTLNLPWSCIRGRGAEMLANGLRVTRRNHSNMIFCPFNRKNISPFKLEKNALLSYD